MRFIAIAVALALSAMPVHAARFQFCWIGSGGYTMLGEIEFPDALLNTGIISEAQLSDFRIQGFRDGLPVGYWSLRMRAPNTSWIVNFDTNTLAFPMGGIRSENSYQSWNANGRVNDCGGDGGFGFNGGNWAQDVCIDNTWIADSSIDPKTPLQAFPMSVSLACEPVLQVS